MKWNIDQKGEDEDLNRSAYSQHYITAHDFLANPSGTQPAPLTNFAINGALLIVNVFIMSTVSLNGLLGMSKSGFL